MSISPDISVVLPVYNGEEHLAEAIDSILAQTFSNFEFIIIDDASTDRTPSILRKYAAMDSRIRIITNVINKKIAACLNHGIAEARSPLVARMDADDWSDPERLEKQFTFMQEKPEVGICGTWLEIYETGDMWKWPCSDEIVRVHMLFNSPIAHPTAMIRRNILVTLGSYATDMPPAEDYDLWARLAMQLEVRFANVPSVLLRYRVYPDSDRTSYYARQMHASDRIRSMLLQQFGLMPSQEQLRHHRILGGVEPARGVHDIVSAIAWKRTLLCANENAKFCDQDALKGFLRNALMRMCCYMSRNFLVKVWRAVMPMCVRKQYSHLKIMMRKAK